MPMARHLWILAALALPAVTVAAYVPALQAEFIFDDDTLLSDNPLMRDAAGVWKFWWTTPRPETRVSERKNVLSMVFYALTVLAYLRYDEDGKRKWYAVAIAAFALALLSKTSGVMLPVALGVLIWWRRGGLKRRDVVRLAPLLALSVAMGVVTVLFQHQMPMGYEHGAPYRLADRIVASGAAVWFYLYKALVPIRLSIVYPRWEIGAVHALGWLSVGGAAALLLWKRRKRWARAGLAAGAWLLLMLLPALGWVPMRWMVYSLVADHFQYLALPAVLAVAIAALWTAARRLPEAARAAVVVLPAIACGVLTFLHAGDYRDSYTLWTDVTRTYPGLSLAHHNRGAALEGREGPQLAIEAYRTALELNPESATTHAVLGSMLLKAGDTAGALHHGQQAVDLRARYVQKYPDLGVSAVFAEAENTVGGALLAQGNPTAALPHFERAMQAAPDLSDSYTNAGLAMIQLRRPVEAEAKLRRAVQLSPGQIEPVYNLGLALHHQGKIEKALQWFQRALELYPDHPRANNNAGAVLGALKRPDDAIAYFERSLQADPANIGTRINLAASLQSVGRTAEATRQYELILRAHPRHTPTWISLGKAHMSLGQFPRAIECFQQASALTGHREPLLLDALAAAYAEVGRFENAVKTAEKALELATAAKLTSHLDGIRKRLALYKAGRPDRQAPPTPAP